MSINIALAEDKKVNRSSFLQKIEALGNLHIVFMAENGAQCLEELKGLPHHLLPKVIFMDLEMPVMDGIETIRNGKSLYPNISFIVLTVFDDDEKIFEAIKAGASGYLLKHEPAEVLQDSIRNVLEFGGAPMSPAIARKTLRLLSVADHSVTDNNSVIPEHLSGREHQILKHLVSGWDAKRIGVALELSVLTVRKHIANIYSKLHVNSKAQAISLAHKNHWI